MLGEELCRRKADAAQGCGARDDADLVGEEHGVPDGRSERVRYGASEHARLVDLDDVAVGVVQE
ncbi:MAG: hypothetical protein ACK54X_14600, partial [Burkholderiales bacterium]